MTAGARLVVLLTLTACAEPAARNPDASPPDARVEPDAPVEEAADARLERLLTGRFSSRAQSEASPAYFDIALESCPVAAPELGSRVLYVEQAVASNRAAPYRQRLYVIERGPAEGEAVSRVFELTDPAAWVGACGEAAPRVADAAAAVEKPGCAVVVRWEGERFVGGTVGDRCVSALNGASYATSEVTLGETVLESWDRGYDASGEQVWGAVDGPYRFDRL